MNNNGKSEEQYQQEFSHLKKMQESTNSAYYNKEKEVTRLTMLNEILVAEKKNWIAEKEKQEALVFQTITNSNKKNNEYLEIIQSAQGTRYMLDKEIVELKKEIARLKNLIVSE